MKLRQAFKVMNRVNKKGGYYRATIYRRSTFKRATDRMWRLISLAGRESRARMREVSTHD